MRVRVRVGVRVRVRVGVGVGIRVRVSSRGARPSLALKEEVQGRSRGDLGEI